ncbi:MAG: DUF3479 domain-containing protein, partial [Rhodobacteraceae bacterium]|nr:DUF3479 domain-containing protein [Paracoccaceae bacterium]
MRDDVMIPLYRVVIITLDSHAAGPLARAQTRLAASFPGLSVTVHAAAEWAETPGALEATIDDIARADIVVCTLLFLEEHVAPILPALRARRDGCDAMLGCISASEIVTLTRMGGLDMAKPASGVMGILKKLRGSKKRGPKEMGGEKQMAALRRLPRILRFIPGKAQDLRLWFLSMQYLLGGSDENFEAMLRALLSRYSSRPEWRGGDAPAPVEYPDVGLYHPDARGRVVENVRDLPSAGGTAGTVGLLMMRSYVLAGDTAHYDAVIRALEGRGLRVLPAFAAGLDGRPAIERYFEGPDGTGIDAMISLTGFSLVGGPAYNDSAAAEEVIARLDVPYVAAHPLEFNTLD